MNLLYLILIYFVFINLCLQNTIAVKNSQNCFVDNDNFIFSNRRTKRVFCESADFKSPNLTCIDNISGEQIESRCQADLKCQDVSEVNSEISKLRCVEAQS